MRRSDAQQLPIPRPQLHHTGIVKCRVRHVIEQHHPPCLLATFAAIRIRHVHDFIPAIPRVGRENRLRPRCRIIVQNPIPSPRRILGTAKANEQHRAERNPRHVEKGEALHATILGLQLRHPGENTKHLLL